MIFPLTSVLWSSFRVTSYLNYRVTTLFESFDFLIYDQDWLLDKVEFGVNLNFIEMDDKCIVSKKLLEI